MEERSVTKKVYTINKDIIRRKEKWNFMVLFPSSKRFFILDKKFSKLVWANWTIAHSKKYFHILQDFLNNKIITHTSQKDNTKKTTKRGDMAPLNVTFQITNRCNLNCVHCHRTKDSFNDLSLSDFKRVIDELRAMKVFNINISWGEPLLHPDIFEMITYALHTWLNVTMSTNLLLRNDEITKKIATLWIRHIHVSLDSHIPETHDKIRGISWSYKQLLNNIEHVKRYNIAYTFVTTIVDQTPEDYQKTIDKAFQLWATAHKTNGFINQWYGKNNEHYVKDFSEHKKIRKEKKQEYTGKMNIIAETMFLIQLGKDYISPKGMPDIINCWCPAGILTCAINEKWEVLACPFFWDEPAGNILKNTFSEVRNKSKLLQQLRERADIKECGTCDFVKICWWCRARSYWLFKAFKKEDPYCFLLTS